MPSPCRVSPRPRAHRAAAVLATFALVGSVSATARAQSAPPPAGPPPATTAAAPPPGFEPQQPQQSPQQPPPGYYPAPGTLPPPQGYPAGPKKLDYHEGDPVPPGYHIASRARRGFVIAGAATLGGGFLLTVVSGLFIQLGCAISENHSGFNNSCDSISSIYVPVAGPFVAIGTSRPTSGGTIAYMAALGAIQTAGLGMLIAGLASREQYLERNDLGKLKVRIAPMSAKGAAGLSLVGSM